MAPRMEQEQPKDDGYSEAMKNYDTMADRLNMPEFVDGLVQDLKDLRAGKVTPHDARVRAELARQILRGVTLMVQATKFIQSGTKLIGDASDAAKKAKTRKSKTIDA